MANPRSGSFGGGNPYGNPTVDFVGALGDIGDTIGAYRQRGAVNDALNSATGPDGQIDFGSAMAGALKMGDLKTAAALGTMADRKFNEQKDTRDFGFRQSEAGRAQSNADRSFGLQERQFNEGVTRNERDFGLKQREFDARFNGEAVPAGFERAQVAGPYSEGAGDYEGQGPFVSQPGQRPVPGGEKDPAYIEAVAKAKLGGGALSDESVDQLADQLNAGDTSVLTNLGRGQQAAVDIRRIRQRAAEKNIEAGFSGKEQALKNAEYGGMKAGQRTLGNQEAKMTTASTELDGAIQQARGVIEKLPRTSFLPFNRLAQGYSTNTLNPDQAELYTRAQAIKNAYAAVMGRGASITTVNAQQHADELLNTAADPATFNRVLATMQQEADMAVNSPEKARALYRRRFGDSAIAPPATAPAAPTAPGGGTTKSGVNWKIL
jgi:hypothetical protein